MDRNGIQKILGTWRPVRPQPQLASPSPIQYRPHLIDGCLAAAGLRIEPLPFR